MASRSNAGERLAVVETELPHVWDAIETSRLETRQAITALETRFDALNQAVTSLRDTVSRYAQTALILATAAMLQIQGAPLAKESGSIASKLFESAVKLLLG